MLPNVRSQKLIRLESVLRPSRLDFAAEFNMYSGLTKPATFGVADAEASAPIEENGT
jgi:hypothetical protein